MSRINKKIIAISGSPHNDGYSAKMLQCFTELLDASSVEHSILIRHYDAFECAFAPCIDCRACREFEGCANDDMDKFFSDFETADGIIFSTPIYNMSFPAPLKAIVDRTQRYYNARFSLGKRPPIDNHRPAALLMSAGSYDEDGDIVIRQLRRIFTVTNCTLVCHAICAGTDCLGRREFLPSGVHDEISRCVNKFGMNLFV